MDISKLVKILIGLVLAFSLGFWLFVWGFGYGYSYSKSNPNPTASIRTPEEIGRQLAAIIDQSPILSLAGKITSISGDAISITVPQLNSTINGKNTPIKRTIKINASTTIKITTPKEQKILDKELATFMAAAKSKKISTSTPQELMPMPYTETTGKISDLKAGDNLEIKTASDIRYATEIVPTQVRVIR